jgi:hypothetical protein
MPYFRLTESMASGYYIGCHLPEGLEVMSSNYAFFLSPAYYDLSGEENYANSRRGGAYKDKFFTISCQRQNAARLHRLLHLH